MSNTRIIIEKNDSTPPLDETTEAEVDPIKAAEIYGSYPPAGLAAGLCEEDSRKITKRKNKRIAPIPTVTTIKPILAVESAAPAVSNLNAAQLDIFQQFDRIEEEFLNQYAKKKGIKINQEKQAEERETKKNKNSIDDLLDGLVNNLDSVFDKVSEVIISTFGEENKNEEIISLKGKPVLSDIFIKIVKRRLSKTSAQDNVELIQEVNLQDVLNVIDSLKFFNKTENSAEAYWRGYIPYFINELKQIDFCPIKQADICHFIQDYCDLLSHFQTLLSYPANEDRVLNILENVGELIVKTQQTVLEEKKSVAAKENEIEGVKKEFTESQKDKTVNISRSNQTWYQNDHTELCSRHVKNFTEFKTNENACLPEPVDQLIEEYTKAKKLLIEAKEIKETYYHYQSEILEKQIQLTIKIRDLEEEKKAFTISYKTNDNQINVLKNVILSEKQKIQNIRDCAKNFKIESLLNKSENLLGAMDSIIKKFPFALDNIKLNASSSYSVRQQAPSPMETQSTLISEDDIFFYYRITSILTSIDDLKLNDHLNKIVEKLTDILKNNSSDIKTYHALLPFYQSLLNAEKRSAIENEFFKLYQDGAKEAETTKIAENLLEKSNISTIPFYEELKHKLIDEITNEFFPDFNEEELKEHAIQKLAQNYVEKLNISTISFYAEFKSLLIRKMAEKFSQDFNKDDLQEYVSKEYILFIKKQYPALNDKNMEEYLEDNPEDPKNDLLKYLNLVGSIYHDIQIFTDKSNREKLTSIIIKLKEYKNYLDKQFHQTESLLSKKNVVDNLLKMTKAKKSVNDCLHDLQEEIKKKQVRDILCEQRDVVGANLLSFIVKTIGNLTVSFASVFFKPARKTAKGALVLKDIKNELGIRDENNQPQTPHP